MAAGHGVRPHHHLEPRRPDRLAEERAVHRHDLLHEPEPRLRVVADAEEARLVLEVVLDHEPDVRLEVGATLRHQRELRGRGARTVRHARAPRQCGGTDGGGGVRVHPGAHALRARLTARRRDLQVGERLAAAVPDAARREDLDHVRAARLGLAHPLPDLVRRARRVGELPGRGDQPWPRVGAIGDEAAELDVLRRPEALHRGEARQERALRVARGGEHPLGRRLSAVRGAAVRAEMGVDVHVRVDEARHQRHRGEVPRDRGAGAPGRDSHDARSLDRDDHVALHAAAAVEQRAGADRHAGVGLRCGASDRHGVRAGDVARGVGGGQRGDGAGEQEGASGDRARMRVARAAVRHRGLGGTDARECGRRRAPRPALATPRVPA